MVARLRALYGRFQETLPGRLVRKFGEDQAANQAVLVAWNALFAMFPIVLVILGVVGVALNAVGLGSGIVQRDVIAALPADSSVQGQVLHALEGVKQQTGLFFVVGFAGLVWSGSSLFGTMESSFDLLWHAKPRGFIQMRLMAVSMIGIFTVLTVIAIGTASMLPLLGRLPDVPPFLTSGPLPTLLQVVVGVGTGFLLFGSMYYVVPNRKQRFGVVWPGALLAGALFEALTLLFPLYLNVNKGIDQYGATFGLMFLLMTFFYFLGLITMLGAELNALLYPVPVARPKEGPDPLAPRRSPESPRRRRLSGPKRAVMAVVGVLVGIFALRKSRDLG